MNFYAVGRRRPVSTCVEKDRNPTITVLIFVHEGGQ